MKKTACIMLLVAAQPAMAASFNGPDLAIALAVQGQIYGGGEHTNNGINGVPFRTASKTEVNANFLLGYNFRATDSLVLGVQAALQPFSTGDKLTLKQAGTLSVNKMTGRYDVSFLPGVLLSETTLLYGKIGYSLAERNVSNLNGAWSDTLEQYGYVLGAGAKTTELGKLIGNDGIYGFAEFNYANYNKEGYRTYNSSGNLVASSPLGLMSKTALIGVGYSF